MHPNKIKAENFKILEFSFRIRSLTFLNGLNFKISSININQIKKILENICMSVVLRYNRYFYSILGN